MQNILDRQNWSALEKSLPGLVPPVELIARLRDYAHRVITWNRKVSNLISKNDEARIVDRHLAESLAPAAWMAAVGVNRWLDMGSGAGFPAIPLILAGVGGHWTLVESRRPKILFLRKTVEDMGLVERVRIVGARLETLEGQIEPVDGFTARATERLAPTLDLAADFVSAGGAAFLWKGSRWSQELIEDRAWDEKWRLEENRPTGTPNIVVVKFVRK